MIPKFPIYLEEREYEAGRDPAVFEPELGRNLTQEEARARGIKVVTRCRDVDTGEMKSAEKEDNHSGIAFMTVQAHRF